MKYFEPRILFGKDNEKFGVPCDGVKTAGAIIYLLSKQLFILKIIRIEINIRLKYS